MGNYTDGPTPLHPREAIHPEPGASHLLSREHGELHSVRQMQEMPHDQKEDWFSRRFLYARYQTIDRPSTSKPVPK
jgi:hypothetical protein